MAKIFGASPTRKMGTLYGTGHLTRAKKEQEAKDLEAARVAVKVEKPKLEAPAARKLADRVATRNRSIN